MLGFTTYVFTDNSTTTVPEMLKEVSKNKTDTEQWISLDKIKRVCISNISV